jgi:hypothetical protein
VLFGEPVRDLDLRERFLGASEELFVVHRPSVISGRHPVKADGRPAA